MKKKGIALMAMLAMSVAAFAAGCGRNSGDPNDPNNPNNPTGPKDDVYVDYDSTKQPGGDSFDYEGNYSAPELTIDGKGDDAQWQAITEPLLTYGKKVDDGNGGTVDAVTVKAYRGEKALFFLFDVKDTTLLTYGVTNDDAVTRGDSIEFYIDTKADGGRNPQSDDFQINLGIHGKTRIMQGSGSNWGSWNGLIDYEVGLNGTLNDGEEATDTGYTVEVMIQYKDIMIEKEDTIGLAFGQVDKVRSEDAPSGSETGPWNWYGWTVNGTLVDPQKPNMYVLYDKDGNLVSRDDIAVPPADMAGAVKDKAGNPVAGATVTTTIGGEEKTATTDETGYFVFEDVDPENNYTVVITKEGYITLTETYTRAELRAANGTIVLKDFTFVATANLTYTTLTGTVKNIVNGAVGGATITLKGTTTTTTADADGAFSLANVPANNGAITFVVSQEGYADSETTVEQAALVEDGTTALGDVNLSLPAAESGAFGMKSGLFANNNAFITRTLTGVEFCFEGTNNFNGWLELFVDTKASAAGTDNRDRTNAQYRLHANGNVEVINYGGDFKTDGIVWTVNLTEGAGYTARAFIPYTTLKIAPLEPFGISLGQNNGQNDWDGWNRGDMLGANGEAFVKPEMPTDYIRVGANNKLYAADHNNALITFGGTVKVGETALAGVTVKIDGTVVATTDNSGAWSNTFVLGTQDYVVTYEKAGYVTKTTNITNASLAGKDAWNETAVLETTKVALSGKVTGADNAGIEEVTVTVTGDGVSLTTTTGADGSYTVEGITVFVNVTVTFTKTDYVTVSDTITAETLAGSAAHTMNKTMQSSAFEKEVTLSGTVKEGTTALEGVTVAVGATTATTDENGEWSITLNLAYNEAATVSYTLAGYKSVQTTIAANTFENQTTWNEDKTLVAEITTVAGTVKNVVYGNVEDVTVAIKGTQSSVTTNANGEFSFEGIRIVDGNITLTVTKSGYETTETTVKATDFVADGTTQLGNISLNLPAVSGVVVASGENTIEATVKVIRTLTGVQFTIDGAHALNSNGQLEVYINKGRTSGGEKENLADGPLWWLDLRADGTISSHADKATASTEGLVYTVHNNTDGYKATLFIPYGYLGMTANPLEVFGFAMGQWLGTNSTWNKMSFNGGVVEVGSTNGYLRINAINGLYRADNNNAAVILSGNAGQSGVTVTVGLQSATTDAQGNWTLVVPATDSALNVVYSKTGYVSKTTSIAAGALSGEYVWNDTVELEEHKVTVSGTVTDQDSAAIEGVTVTLTVGSETKTTTTGSNGKYSFENVTTFEGVSIAFKKEGYAVVAATTVTQQALASAENNIYTADRQLTATSNIKLITVTGKVVGIEGNLEGATVSVAGKDISATTLQDGTFTLSEFELVDSEITITLNGYRTETIAFEASAVGADDTTFAFASDVFLAREYEQLGSAFGTKSDAFAHFVPYVTRGQTGFEFKFVGSKAFAGHIEMFVDTKQSNGDGARNNTDYRFDLKADGSIVIENWGGGTNKTVSADMKLEIKGTAEVPEVYFTLPYAFLGVERTEIIGVSFGQVSEGWDGWTLTEEYASMKGIREMFVKPEMTWDYIRIGVDNKPFWNAANYTVEELDLTKHLIYLANDEFIIKVSRSDTGITIDAVSFGDFNKDGAYNELLLAYFDFGAVEGGWAGVDYLVKIASDGQVYGGGSVSKKALDAGKGASWWKESEADKIGNATITTGTGYKRYVFTITYEEFNSDLPAENQIGATQVFGVQFRHASQNSTADHALHDGNCSLDTTVTGDTANCANYIRVKLDGSYVIAQSNAAATTTEE